MNNDITNEAEDESKVISDQPTEDQPKEEEKPIEFQGFQFKDPFIDHVLFDHANNINEDQAYWFQLRGNSTNKFVDCASPLIGMVLRARTQSAAHKEIKRLHKQCVNEIKAIELELIEDKYEYPVIVAYRYVLCTFIDEAIMSTSWGSQSEWSSKSLLVHFHNEAWGGEKTFLIIERLEKEVERYYDLLEFIFLCLCLGFEGRFKVLNHPQEGSERVVANLYEKLRQHTKWEAEELTRPYDNIISSSYFLKKELTVKKIAISFISILCVCYLFYLIYLGIQSDNVIDELRSLL